MLAELIGVAHLSFLESGIGGIPCAERALPCSRNHNFDAALPLLPDSSPIPSSLGTLRPDRAPIWPPALSRGLRGPQGPLSVYVPVRPVRAGAVSFSEGSIHHAPSRR